MKLLFNGNCSHLLLAVMTILRISTYSHSPISQNASLLQPLASLPQATWADLPPLPPGLHPAPLLLLAVA
uniref:Uncharacterized protein n=1 Tax=Setaria viridis TaxID=4556 RepID=A0A4U6TMC2_SETVI|nr:hypothetical protein SEVIR_8G235450v2 [Setaria viridis]